MTKFKTEPHPLHSYIRNKTVSGPGVGPLGLLSGAVTGDCALKAGNCATSFCVVSYTSGVCLMSIFLMQDVHNVITLLGGSSIMGTDNILRQLLNKLCLSYLLHFAFGKSIDSS